MRHVLRILVILRRSVLRAMDHDAFNLAQSAAYSALVALFPALVVAATAIAVLPDNAPLRAQMGAFFYRILPPDVVPMLGEFFDAHNKKSGGALVLALLVSLSGAASVISTYMEGLRRANDLPDTCWTFWGIRLRSYVLVPLSLIPLGVASLSVVFGHFVTLWLAYSVVPSMRTEVYILSSLVRWLVALAASIGLIGVIYHRGTPARQPWRSVVPGAAAATIMWFVTTLIFGWYVTRFANYSQVYGSLGAGIALLFWLYIVSLSILFGAEFNVQFHLHAEGGGAETS